ncbi:MAG: glycosyltransferase family 4 protein [Rhodospirillaceae bacterium]|nr:glycosyltransferase family 4 protein [Rhodospirillaceae bacterium]
MRIAFYAPLKPPDHPVPSGDRRMARLLMAALARAGHVVELASRLRSRASDPAHQAGIAAQAARSAERLLARYGARPAEARPQAWLTYHVYYKAPDWIGPAVCRSLGIPYLVAEASHAGKRAAGPWAPGHDAAARAIRQAEAVLMINPADAEGLRPLLAAPGRLVPLKPFLEDAAFERPDTPRAALRQEIAARLGLDPGATWLLAVAMMRPGDKLASYRVLGRALERLAEGPAWALVVVGDGPARDAVDEALRGVAGRVRQLGALPTEAIAPLHAACDLFVWPAVNEAYGMALLEAQAAGLPAVAGAAGGVPAIVQDGMTGLLVPPESDEAFADAVRRLIADTDGRARMGEAARRKALAEHRIATAAAVLDDTLRRVVAAWTP